MFLPGGRCPCTTCFYLEADVPESCVFYLQADTPVSDSMCFYLEADADIDSAAEAGGDGARREVERGEELGEVGRQVDARPLLGDDAQRAHAAQVHALRAQSRRGRAQPLGTQLHHPIRAERVSHCKERRRC